MSESYHYKVVITHSITHSESYDSTHCHLGGGGCNLVWGGTVKDLFTIRNTIRNSDFGG